MSVKAIIPYSAEERRKATRSLCIVSGGGLSLSWNMHIQHGCSHLHPSTNTHSHCLCVFFFKCQHALSTCCPESVCLYVCEGACPRPVLLIAYAWMAEADLFAITGEHWRGWAKSVENLPHLIGLILKPKSYAMCYVSNKYWNLGWCEGKWSMKWAAECHQGTTVCKRDRERQGYKSAGPFKFLTLP